MEKVAVKRLKKVDNKGVEPMTFPMLRDALSLVIDDLFYEFSAFHSLNESFTLAGFGWYNLRAFSIPKAHLLWSIYFYRYYVVQTVWSYSHKSQHNTCW